VSEEVLLSGVTGLYICSICIVNLYISFHLSGTAVVTATEAAIWVDGRYHLQAEAQTDDNWTVMKEGSYSHLLSLHIPAHPTPIHIRGYNFSLKHQSNS